MMRWLPILAVAMSAVSTAAHASCALGQFVATGVVATYDPFETAVASTPISIRGNSVGDCRGARVQFAVVRTAVSPQSGSAVVLTGPTSQLSGAILDASGGGRPIAGSQAVAFVDQPPFAVLGATGLQSGAPNLRLAITPGQPAPPANYDAHLLLVARVTDSRGETSQSATPLELAVMVKPSVRLAAGGELAIDFGEMKPGEIGTPVRFDAYSNLDYELVVRSENDFALARPGGGRAPYDVYVSSRPVTQAGAGETRSVQFPAPGGDGRRNHSFSVRLQPFAPLPAGVYNDQVTLEIRARV